METKEQWEARLKLTEEILSEAISIEEKKAKLISIPRLEVALTVTPEGECTLLVHGSDFVLEKFTNEVIAEIYIRKHNFCLIKGIN